MRYALLGLILFTGCSLEAGCNSQPSGPTTVERQLELCKSDVQAWKAKSNELQSSLDACASAAVDKTQGK